MGNKPHKFKKTKEMKALMEKTKFSLEELGALHAQFMGIKGAEAEEGKADDQINREEFQRALGSKSSMFVNRIFDLFDENHDGKITFPEFASGISILSPKGTYKMKLAFSFAVYDLNGDGKIDKTELRKMLETSMEENGVPLSASQIDGLVDSTFAQADLNGDGFIDLAEYTAMVNKHRAMIGHLDLNVTDMIKEAQAAAAAAGSAAAGSRK